MIISAGIRLKYYLEISKLRIMIPVSLTGFTGYFIFDPHLSFKIVLISTGILLMAISASVLNQLQEVDIDSRMARTMNRPIPSGKISKKDAFIFFLITIISGTALIYAVGNFLASIIGLTTIFWYNCIYTYSKRVTAFAVVPGAVTGALPPLIGWVAAGGGMWDKSIIFIEFLFFIGQIPHFWLLVLKYGDDYKKAGLPNLTDILNISQIYRLTFMWVLSSVAAALFLCYFGILSNMHLIIILIIASALLIWQFLDLIRLKIRQNSYKKYSILLDSYFLLVLLLLIVDRIIT